MLIVVERETADSLNERLEQPEVRVGLSRLLNAVLDGFHILVMPPKLCRSIESSDIFSQDERAAAAKVRGKYFSYGHLHGSLQVFGVVTHGDGAVFPSRDNGVWRMPLAWIAKRPLQRTAVVAEDYRDCGILVHAGQKALALDGLSTFLVNSESIAGGGANTWRAYEKVALEDQRITVCFVDSDKTCEDSPLGATASRCRDVSGDGVHELRTTLGRELENALPWSLLDCVKQGWTPPVSSRLSSLEKSVPNASRFVSLKIGLCGHDLRCLSVGLCAQFAQALSQGLGFPEVVACCDVACKEDRRGECKGNLLPAMGKDLLKEVLEVLNGHAFDGFGCGQDTVEWRDVGVWVAHYCLGAAPQRL